MKPLAGIMIGWIVPGGAAFLNRRYMRAALVFLAVSATFMAGLALQGGNLFPRAEEMQGLDRMTSMMAQAGAATQLLAGGPALLSHFAGYSQSFMNGRLHEQGTTFLVVAGIINLLALGDAFPKPGE